MFEFAFADFGISLCRMTDALARSLPTPHSIRLAGVKLMPMHAKDITTVDVVTLAGPFFYILVLMQMLPVFISNIVYEKEGKVRQR